MEKVLPKGWVESEIRDLTSFVIGGDWGKDIDFIFEEESVLVSCIRGSEIKKWNTEKGKTSSIRRIKKNSREKRALIKGDILIEISGGGPDQPVGRAIIIDEDAIAVNSEYDKVCTNFLRLLRLTDSVSKQYVKKYLDLFYLSGEIIKYQGGSNNLRNLKYKEFETIRVPLPPLAEQQRIVTKLDSLFAHLEEVTLRMVRVPLLLKNFRQAILTQAVTGKLTEEWRVGKELGDATQWRKEIIQERYALGLPKRTPGLVYQEVEGGIEIPSSWTYGFLQNFGEFTRGKSKHRPRNDKKLFGGNYPFIQTGEVARSNGFIENYKVTYSDFGLSQSRLFPAGTLCITIAANIAETGILGFDACFPDSVVGYLPYKGLYSAKFAMYCLNTMQKDLEHYAPSTAQKNINLGILFEVPFPVPPQKEQTEIVRRVESLFAKADRIEAQYKQLKAKIDALPQALLAKAFRGELVEQLSTDGDAKDLLAEIAKLKAEAMVKPKAKRKVVKPKVDIAAEAEGDYKRKN